MQTKNNICGILLVVIFANSFKSCQTKNLLAMPINDYLYWYCTSPVGYIDNLVEDLIVKGAMLFLLTDMGAYTHNFCQL